MKYFPSTERQLWDSRIGILWDSLCVHAYVKWFQLHLTLCDPMDCSPRGCSVHGILQTKILEWVAMPSSRGSSWPRQGLNQCSLMSFLLAALQNAYFHTCKNVWNITILQGSLPLHPYQSLFTNHEGSWILKKKPSNKIYMLYVRGWQFFAAKARQ